MLHDYSRFRITTIDSFFQSIVRELAYELDLTANLRVDLNAKEALEETVKSIVEDLNNHYSEDDRVRNGRGGKQRENALDGHLDQFYVRTH